MTMFKFEPAKAKPSPASQDTSTKTSKKSSAEQINKFYWDLFECGRKQLNPEHQTDPFSTCEPECKNYFENK